MSKKPVIARRPNGPTWQSVTPVPWPPCERPIPLIKGKCPEGTKGIGLGGTAQHPQGVRRIRKAAKLPTAAQPVTEGFRPHVPSLPPPRGKVPPQGADEGDPRGCIHQRRAAEDSGPYGRDSSHSVGADVPIRPECLPCTPPPGGQRPPALSVTDAASPLRVLRSSE